MALRNDTIVAQATGGSKAAIAILRVSGPKTRFVLETMIGPLPPPRRLERKAVMDPISGAMVDRGLVAWFPGPASYSGEDMAEFHVHGGLAIVGAMLRALTSFRNVRLAEPGEFTRRAVLGGKLDLTAAEALGDLIDAETEAQRRQALRQLDGSLGTLVAAWREELIGALALIEADLDFSDEGDVGDGLVADAARRLRPILSELDGVLAERGGERLRRGLVVVIAGPPNAGKSSLLNFLARREVAIVSPFAGTTRDALEVHCDIGGCPVLLVDTAGLREAQDPVEEVGVARARTRIEEADLVLWLDPIDSEMQRVPEELGDGQAEVIRVRTKADLASGAAEREMAVSVVTGAGVDGLLDLLGRWAVNATGSGHAAVITRERHRSLLLEARAALAAALAFPKPAVLLAEDIRRALRGIGAITGHVGAEAVLDRIFSTFCIGK